MPQLSDTPKLLDARSGDRIGDTLIRDQLAPEFLVEGDSQLLGEVSRVLARAGYEARPSQSGADGRIAFVRRYEERACDPRLDKLLGEMYAADRRLRIVTSNRGALPDLLSLHPEAIHQCSDGDQSPVALCADLLRQGHRPIWLTDGRRLSDALHRLRDFREPLLVVLESDGDHDLSLLRTLTSFRVAEACDPAELAAMTVALAECGEPAVVRWAAPPPLPNDERAGLQVHGTGSRGELLVDGNGIGIIALGAAVPRALAGARLLQRKGLSPRVVSARMLSPLDRDLLVATALRCAHLVVVEEGVAGGGFAGAILASLAESGVPDRSLKTLGASATADDIAQAGLEIMGPSLGAVSDSLGPWLEQQRHPRVEANTPVYVTVNTEIGVQIRAGNISEGGMFLEMTDPPPVGTVVPVEFAPQPGFERIRGDAEVVWARDVENSGPDMPAGAGVRFLAIHGDGQDLLRDYVALERSKVATGSARPKRGPAPGPLQLKTNKPPARAPGNTDVPIMVLDLPELGEATGEELALSESLQGWVDGFREITGRRGFLWRWCYKGVLLSRLRCVDETHARRAHEAKLLALLFDLLVEDSVDTRHPAYEGENRVSDGALDTLLQVPFVTAANRRISGLSPEDVDRVALAIELWDAIRERISASRATSSSASSSSSTCARSSAGPTTSTSSTVTRKPATSASSRPTIRTGCTSCSPARSTSWPRRASPRASFHLCERSSGKPRSWATSPTGSRAGSGSCDTSTSAVRSSLGP